MPRDIQKPALLVGLAMVLLLTGGFFTVLSVGMSARQNKGISYGFSFRGAALAASTYAEDLERGSKIVKSRSAALFDEYFGSGSIAYPPEENYASSRGAYGPGSEVEGQYSPEESAFDKYYQDNYGSGSSEYSPSSSYGGGSGIGSFAGSGGGGSSQDMPRAAAGAEKTPVGGETAGAGEEEAPAGESGRDARAAVLAGGLSPAPKMYASLPSKGADRVNSVLPSGGGAPAEFDGGSRTAAPAGKGRGLDAFSGGGAAKNLDGADEGSRTGAQGSYNAKMGGGAAATAAASSSSGGGTPSASGPEAVAGGSGGSSGSSSASSSPSAAPSLGRDYSEPDSSSGDQKSYTAFGDQPAEEGDLLKSVVVDRRNGAEDKYVSESEAAVEIDEALLKPGAAAGDAPRSATGTGEKKALAAAEPDPDPEDFSALTEARRLEIRKKIHVILKRVERRYGAMADIEYVPCTATAAVETCEKHGLTRNFITMTTGRGATLALAVKYVRNRWRPYTIGFKPPPGQAVQQGAGTETENYDGEDEYD